MVAPGLVLLLSAAGTGGPPLAGSACSAQAEDSCLDVGGCMWCTSNRGAECQESGPPSSPVWACRNSTAPPPPPPPDRTVSLAGGVDMPVVALGTGGYDNATAEAAVKLALASGLNHIHTAFDYFNQPGVGRGLVGRPRHSFFITTMTSPCIHTASNPHRNVTDPAACLALTKKEVAEDLAHLQLDHVDLLLLHGPAQAYGTKGVCQPEICDITRAQWQAYVDLQKEGKARAIGVSNFCPSCFACLASSSSPVWPAVNQVRHCSGCRPWCSGCRPNT